MPCSLRWDRWRWWSSSCSGPGAFIVGFSLMLQSTTHHVGDAFLQATGAMFTVGAVHLGGPQNTAVDITAGASWAVVVALQIAYLPALYGAFNRREALVAMLESRAGVPAWGPEVLARHQLVGIIDALPASTPTGNYGPPTSPRATPPIPSSCCSGHRSPGSRGSSGCSPSSTAPPCIWPCPRAPRPPRLGCASEWG